MADPAPPPAMYRGDRPVVETFHPDEYLFRRVHPSCWGGGEPLPTLDAMPLPDTSVCRSRFGHPEWVRFDTYSDKVKYFKKWGVVGVRVGSLPPAVESDGGPAIACQTFHDPQPRDYPHSEIRAFAVGVHLSTLDAIPEDQHLAWRARLLAVTEAVIRPGESREIRQAEPASHLLEPVTPAAR